jgi:hypothetical protein
MSETDPKCFDGGLITGTRDLVPEDPSVRYVEKGNVVGCNRIFCNECRTWIRHLDGARILDPWPGTDTISQLYGDSNLARSPLISAEPIDGAWRTYLCRCSWACSAGSKRLAHIDDANWFCAGHPKKS